MRIRLAFATVPSEPDAPWLVAAVDEYTEDSRGGTAPDWYTAELSKARTTDPGTETREVWVEIDDREIQRRFGTPTIPAEVLADE